MTLPAIDHNSWEWMQTYSGRKFYPLNPREQDIAIEDIAHALSLICRYGGHCLKFYSVAEHCVLMAAKALAPLKLTTLLHDASEAYLGDVIRPLKRNFTAYKAAEMAVEQVIASKFGTQFPLPKEVKALDEAILFDELEQNMSYPPEPWHVTKGLGVKLQFWKPIRAEAEFLKAFKDLT
jgi:uncharacterized protein